MRMMFETTVQARRYLALLPLGEFEVSDPMEFSESISSLVFLVVVPAVVFVSVTVKGVGAALGESLGASGDGVLLEELLLLLDLLLDLLVLDEDFLLDLEDDDF